ncbi:MAG: putative ABC transporter ATP-binding protein YheS [Anaerolineales bacterium]|nr:putative ABC transporter ATP-binding protein YheS [Anaerolineales bacterium]
MLRVDHVSKTYGHQQTLEDISFIVSPGDRVGLVGPNGCGKTTLLRIMASLEAPDAGHVFVDPSTTLGYLPQGLEPEPGETVGQAVRAGISGLEPARRALRRLTAQMENASEGRLPALIEAYGDALSRFEALDGYAVEHEVEVVLAGLGLDGVAPDEPAERLSGGEKTRVALARVLIQRPTTLLLDEPTNHLDIEALEWLEDFLAEYHGAALIVSHDRTFLDRTVDRILELDATTHTATEYAGNYSDYEAAKEWEIEQQWGAWRDQQAEMRRIEADIRRTKQQAQRTEQATTDDHLRRLAKKVAKKAKARERRLRRMLDAEDRVEQPEQPWQLKFEFGDMPRGGQIVLRLEGVGHRFNDWLFRDADLTLQHGERVALLGRNGTGKTTLLRIIAGQLAPAEGAVEVGANVRLGYMSQEQRGLDPDGTPLSVVRRMAPMTETEARSFLHFFLFAGDDVFVPVHKLSYGERARLILAKLIVAGANCLLLDEPINYLDIPSRERFEAALDAFPGTVLAVVHDRAFIDRFATGIWAVEAGTIRRYIDRKEMQRMRDQRDESSTRSPQKEREIPPSED